MNVGPLRWLLHAPPGAEIRYRDPAYAGFLGSSELSGRSPLREMAVEMQPGALEVPRDQPVFRSGLTWALWDRGEAMLLCWGIHERRFARAACLVSRDLTSARLWVDGDASLDPLVYPLDQILSWGMLARCGGILLHAAVAVKDGVGWVFTGRSGAGKSTLSGLCHAEGWRIFNDDRVMLFFRDGVPAVAGTPWHGSGRFAEAAEAPLGGIFLLEQASSERLEPLSPAQARLGLLHVAGIPWFEEEWTQGALDALDALTRAVPVQRFHFTRSPAAVRALAEYAARREEAVA